MSFFEGGVALLFLLDLADFGRGGMSLVLVDSRSYHSDSRLLSFQLDDLPRPWLEKYVLSPPAVAYGVLRPGVKGLSGRDGPLNDFSGSFLTNVLDGGGGKYLLSLGGGGGGGGSPLETLKYAD